MKRYKVLIVAIIVTSSVSVGCAQANNESQYASRNSLNQAQQLILGNFPTVYTNGLGVDAEEWEQSIRIDEEKKVIEYRRRPFVANNTKSDWFATMIVPLEAITAIDEEHKGHTITIHTNGNQIACYNFDLLAAKSSTLTINMRDLDRVRYLAERVYSRIKHFCDEQAKLKD